MNKKWYEAQGEMGGIAVSTRVRLARNIKEYPFPGRMTREQETKVLESVSRTLTESAGGKEFRLTDLSQLEPVRALALVERHLISPELATGGGVRGVVLSSDESVSVMINEEDHLRIQVMGAGVCLEECFEKAERVDNLLESALGFAFDERLGYLTHCPTNLGTGLRASVMLHLPALTETGEIRGLITACGKLGFAVRGLYGEGSSARGALYQVSNQLTLGLSEREILERLGEAVKNVIGRETGLRELVRQQNPGLLEDRAWRAAGILAAARRIDSGEAMQQISNLRMGVSMGVVPNIGMEDINRLIWEIQPNCLSLESGPAANTGERDMKRAEIIRGVAIKALQSKGAV